jgi:peptidyl-prolyl cis-trans isomerase C
MPLSTQTEIEVETVATSLSIVDEGEPRECHLTSWRRAAIPWLKTPSLRSVMREPLAHFLLAGALLLILSSLFGRSAAGNNRSRIQVSAPEIQRLREIWTRQWGRPPDAKQTDNLIADYVREEIYYREALDSGLDKDDTIIRRRLVEKMEFLSQEIASTSNPSEADLQQFFESNRQKYSLPAEAGFTHIYFSSSRRGAAAFQDARDVLARLESSQISRADAAILGARLGDNFMLRSEYPPQTRDQIKNLFGDEFAVKVLELESGKWAGPVRSTYGWHLVCVLEHVAPRLPALSEIRSQVAIDYKNQRLQAASDGYYDRLRKRYQVEIDQGALAAAKSQAVPAPSAAPTAGSAADVD